jgi:hypothetical protein
MRTEASALHFDQVNQPPRCGHHRFHACLQHLELLELRHPAVDRADLEAEALGELLRLRVDLRRELARRRQHDHDRALVLLQLWLVH